MKSAVGADIVLGTEFPWHIAAPHILRALPSPDFLALAVASAACSDAACIEPLVNRVQEAFGGDLVSLRRVESLLELSAERNVEACQLQQWAENAMRLAHPLERMLNFLPRPVAAAPILGNDLFAACKRAVVSSQMEPCFAQRGRVCAWINLPLEAMEAKDIDVALPFWDGQGDDTLDFLADECDAVRGQWLVQLAHYLDEMPRLVAVLKKNKKLCQGVADYATQLREQPHRGYFREMERPIRSERVSRLVAQASLSA